MWEGTLNTCLFQLKINRSFPFSLLQKQKMKHYHNNNRNLATWSLLIERETQEGKSRRASAENNGERASHANAGFRQVRVPCANGVKRYENVSEEKKNPFGLAVTISELK